jgi:TonB family protein
LNVEQLPRLQQNWIQPSSLDRSTSTEGLDGEITIEPKSISKITPVGTRMPIIPKVAWDNKINGWVLLSFTVSSEGRVRDIRILDASPKGVFEENAVLAVSKWRYQGFIGYDRYVSQKIEFEWKNYPYNWDY